MSLLEMSGVRKIYGQGATEVAALDGVDLRLEKAEFTTVFGPSGSGKTTLLNIIGALDTPTRGRVMFKGQNTARMKEKELAMLRRKNIGFIFQSYNLLPVLTAYENVEFALRIAKGNRGEKNRKKVLDLLEAVGLGGMEDRKPHELSGGQKQRVAIARALINNPPVILADEPTANLDKDTAIEIFRVLIALKEAGKSVIVVTHSDYMHSLSDRSYTMINGILRRL